MATGNPFDLLGDDDNDDPSQLIASQLQKIVSKKPVASPPPPASAKFPSKPIPPSQALKGARDEAVMAPRGGGRGPTGRGRGRRGSGPNRDFTSTGNVNDITGSYGSAAEDGEPSRPLGRGRGSYGAPRQSYRGGRRGYNGNEDFGGDSEKPPHRQFDRSSGAGYGYEIKREGAGRGNWGTTSDEVFAQEREETERMGLIPEKQAGQDDILASDANKEGKEVEEKEPEGKEMTLDEYEKVLEEKRKAMLAMKQEERKVGFDKEFESMQQLSLKKGNDDIFIKLGSDKDAAKRKENADRDEKVKKSLSINEFLKPAEGERYFGSGGRGRGRGRGDRPPFRGGSFGGSSSTSSPAAPSIGDPGQFPTLAGK